jgi:hypothetical protein
MTSSDYPGGHAARDFPGGPRLALRTGAAITEE